ncbi:hypothetical protein KY314_00595 [Candidatus Woesearchaeota archaeon]|nr:hypothetical protein [Candidatus Woesearchaeota archaeon]
MYEDLYSDKMIKKLIKIKKKDLKQYEILRKKINEIIANPKHNYKFLRHGMQGINRIHIRHFVLIFIINHVNKTISFEDYEHHDMIYRA